MPRGQSIGQEAREESGLSFTLMSVGTLICVIVYRKMCLVFKMVLCKYSESAISCLKE